ncbi:mannitol dehydrogenase family protein [Rhizorhabdus dicambivorans]|uniref:Mannitol dehydrogenase family protein n=1 Tax=Rhizorhabdus dicambivorans TaxID=1850238 RepID=A0A2A4FTX2_9SPHN|nr:mannitol dehydrogenase family protein [Rhizorhabdus dicambivorans]ATE64533.1 mannitol dehydrogenase family protein [Rhizorhabdus dicambivorans]PCE41627.1 mannitol dehydrogenase family protein [Rhizorhabdus dicambivorans]
MSASRPSQAQLPILARRVAVPAYDRAALKPGIVHIGLGNFHRAHMARYTDALMAREPSASAWGIMGAGLLPGDAPLHDHLRAQDWLYTLVERGEGERVAIVGSLVGTILAAGSSAALVEAMARPETRIVSLTVTEHGYCLDAATRRLDRDHPAILADLADPGHPRSAVGIIVEAFRKRMIAGFGAFTAMSCDNIQHNGHMLAQAVLDFAAWRSPALAAWIASHARFPSTMVDRITPVTRPEDIADLAARHGIDDAAAVFCESFSQWVIEDDFADGRPAWDSVGAQFVDDVTPYELMKLRLLNASHLAIAGPARLMGHDYVHEAMADGLVRRFMARLMDAETGPTLPPVPGIDLDRYKATLIRRFANPAIRDRVERVNSDAALNYLLDPVRDRLTKEEPVDLLGFGVAAWIRRMRGEDEAGGPIEVRHPLAALLRERTIEGGPDPLPVLRIASLFGDLVDHVGFVATVARSLAAIYALGCRAALERLAEEQGF